MIHSKSLQRIIGAILVLNLLGCVAPVLPVPTQPEVVIASPAPKKTEMVIVSPTSTQISISNFGECFALGNPIQHTFPRQCTSAIGKIFKEALPEGVIFGKVYSKDGYAERAHSIISTMDGGYLIIGEANISQCLIRKLDPTGETQWEHALGLELRDKFQFTNGLFTCWSAKQITEGGYVVIGTEHQEFGIKSNSFLLKLGPDGNMISANEFLWKSGMSLQFDQEGKSFWLSLFGLSGKLIETSDKGYAVVGRLAGTASDKSTHIIKTDEDGNYVWERNLCRDRNISEPWEKEIVCSDNGLWDVIQSRDGGYVMTGGFNGAWLVKADLNGDVEWIQSYSQKSWNAGHALIQLQNGDYLIAGAQLIDQTYQDGLLIKTDSAGNLQWSRTYGGDQHDRFLLMEQGADDKVIIIGSTDSFGEGTDNIWLLGFDIANLK